jgi:hypothetical protein
MCKECLKTNGVSQTRGKLYMVETLTKKNINLIKEILRDGANLYMFTYIKGAYYFFGEAEKEQQEFMKSLIKIGKTVFHAYGIPPTLCGGEGQPKCKP